MVNATPRPLYPPERPSTHCTGGWVGRRAGLDGCGKSRPTGIRSPDRPDLSESLHRLRYPGPRRVLVAHKIWTTRRLAYDSAEVFASDGLRQKLHMSTTLQLPQLHLKDAPAPDSGMTHYESRPFQSSAKKFICQEFACTAQPYYLTFRHHASYI